MKLFSILLSSLAINTCLAQSINLDTTTGLKRFDSSLVLPLTSTLTVGSVNTGENIKRVTQRLLEQGGELHYISGGIRSRQLKVSFFQPYLTSRLEQRMELEFDKQYGFIQQVEQTWLIESAYLSIAPIYQKVVLQAIDKYGSPLTIEQVNDVAKSSGDNLRLTRFIKNLPQEGQFAEAINTYFEDKVVTPKTRFERDDKDLALLKTGFKQCYFWQVDNYTEILSLCSFQPTSGNMKGQGVSLKLVNFAVDEAIVNYSHSDDGDINIEL